MPIDESKRLPQMAQIAANKKDIEGGKMPQKVCLRETKRHQQTKPQRMQEKRPNK
jgi:hypothetical protein